MYQVPNMINPAQYDMRIGRRPFGGPFGRPFGRPFGFGFGGFGFPLGFIGGLAAGSLIRPPFYSPYPPFWGGWW
ncbi:hypothetical protein [Robertmurraya sp. Marseille-Q9965]